MFQAVDVGEQIGISARGVKSSGSHLPSALTPFEPKHVWGEPATWTRSPFLDVVSTGSCNHSCPPSCRLLCLLFRFCPSQRAETKLPLVEPASFARDAAAGDAADLATECVHAFLYFTCTIRERLEKLSRVCIL